MSRALVVAGSGGTLESRKIKLIVEIEGAVMASQVVGVKPKIERVRFEDGRWRKASLLIQRLRALGVELKDFEIGGAGDHTPIY